METRLLLLRRELIPQPADLRLSLRFIQSVLFRFKIVKHFLRLRSLFIYSEVFLSI